MLQFCATDLLDLVKETLNLKWSLKCELSHYPRIIQANHTWQWHRIDIPHSIIEGSFAVLLYLNNIKKQNVYFQCFYNPFHANVPFLNFLKARNTSSFSAFSEGIDRKHWREMSEALSNKCTKITQIIM